MEAATTALSPLDLVAAAYGMQLRDYGASPRGVLWSCRKNQQVRFRTLIKVIDPEDASRQMTVNDLGCGYGAFFDFLAGRGIIAVGRYFGYDICRDMIAAAQGRIGDPRARFSCSMVATEVADYSFASGTYNLKGPVCDGDWTTYVKDSLTRLWRQSATGLAFNLLNRAAEPEPKAWLYYADADEFHDFCRRDLSANAVRIEGEHPKDCTILIRRDP